MNKEFIPYEQALELKELGFDEECLATYNFNQELETGLFQGHYDVPAPLYQQAFRFFRSKYNMLANVYSNASGFLYEYHDTIGGTHRFDSGFEGTNASGCWDSYEETELACIKKLIQVVKQSL